jgi:hypothetical protein
MPQQDSGPDARAQASAAAHRAITGLATGRGAEFTTRPAFPGSDITVRDFEPLTGARAARDIELATRKAARDYIRRAREAGHGWDQIGHALGWTPGGDVGQQAATAADAAYTYAVGRPETEAPWQPRSFTWTCRSCDQAISDRGLITGPAQDEQGHVDGCRRLAAAITEWNASLEADLEAER